jgi:hypothetical protein
MAWGAVIAALASKMGQQQGGSQGPAFTVQESEVPKTGMDFSAQTLTQPRESRQTPYTIASGMAEEPRQPRRFY